MFRSTGTLEYHSGPSKVVVQIDPEIGRYYLAQVPKSVRLRKPRYRTHISVVRKENPDFTHWEKYQGATVDFEYSHHIYSSHVYCWINIYSPFLEMVRTELGLRLRSEFVGIYKESPGARHVFHSTIGNFK